MVRTRADAMTIRVAAAKAPRKNLAGPSNTNPNSDKNTKGREHTGGNTYCPRETPKWQKPITSFFIRPPESGESSKREEKTDYLNDDLAAGSPTSGGSTSKEDTTD